MFEQDGYTDLFVARLFDFFHRRSPSQRRLWRTGLVLELREVAEYSRVYASGTTSEQGLKYVVGCVTRLANGSRCDLEVVGDVLDGPELIACVVLPCLSRHGPVIDQRNTSRGST